MSKQRCEGCKYSYQYGNLMWSESELRCRKFHDISWVGLDRIIRKKGCEDYERK